MAPAARLVVQGLWDQVPLRLNGLLKKNGMSFIPDAVVQCAVGEMAQKTFKVVAALFAAFQGTNSAATFTPFLPPSYPLAVRNPYLSAWLPGPQASSDFTSTVPQFWSGDNLTWSVIARVDGTAYNLVGVPSPESDTQSASLSEGKFTTTHSIFTLTAGNANITLDYFSPVSFDNYVRQSLPFSYLTVSAVGLDGNTPDVQVYSDIDGTWTGDEASTSTSFSISGTASIFELSVPGAATYSQSSYEHALWGTAVWSSESSDNSTLTTQSGASSTVRSQFVSNGSLAGTHATWASGDVAGLAHDFGTVSSTTSATFAIGVVREDAVNYLGTAYTHYYRATYSDIASTVTHFFDDYSAAASEGSDLDSTVSTTGNSVAGSNYAAILELSVRQTFGGIDLTIPGDTLNTDEAYAFIKEISSNGNTNTVDIIVELIPFFAIFNIEWLKLLLDPVVAYLEGDEWTYDWCIHDIGSAYPNATGHPNNDDAEQMPVEESGNILIMAAIYQEVSGDTSWATSHESLFAGYADYLIDNGLYPTNQLSTNDGLGSFTNMTQLGVKAAVALSAYGLITGNETYTNYGDSFADTIYTDGVGVRISSTTNQTYFTLTYQSSTWFMLFNLYPAKYLNLTLFPEAAYTGQSALYATVAGEYGIPLEGEVEWGKTDWQMWSAAVASTEVRTQMIDDLYSYMSNGLNDDPFADRYWATGDEAGLGANSFRARPVLGAHFAPWAYDLR